MQLPLDKAFLNVGHGVNYQLHQSAVDDSGFLEDIIVLQQVADLTFAVGTGSAEIFLNLRAGLVTERVDDLFQFLTS